MKAEVEKELCISCSLCVNDVPDVFSWDDDDKAVAKDMDLDGELAIAVEEVIDACPTDAIKEV